ncbi:unnamed protein product [Urochloa humidicola]
MAEAKKLSSSHAVSTSSIFPALLCHGSLSTSSLFVAAPSRRALLFIPCSPSLGTMQVISSDLLVMNVVWLAPSYAEPVANMVLAVNGSRWCGTAGQW